MNWNYYLPIPSLDYRYEINLTGTVRNAKTKRVLKITRRKYNGDYLSLHFRGKTISRAITSLLHEVHGIAPKRGQLDPVAVTVSSNSARRSFKSLRACAKFLCTVTCHTFYAALRQLSARFDNICGWHIRYREPELRTFPKRRVLHHKHKGD